MEKKLNKKQKITIGITSGAVALAILLVGLAHIFLMKCTISFNTNGGKPRIETQEVRKGSKVEEPKTIKKDGYTFECWSYNDTKWDFAKDKVKNDMTLTAQWKANEYSITYNLDGGVNNEENPTSYTYGEDITLKAPTKEYYAFKGWMDQKGNVEQSVFSNCLGDMTFTALWEENYYTITLKEGFSNSDVYYVTKGESFIMPEATEKYGYFFSYWGSSDISEHLKAGDSFTPTQDITFIATYMNFICHVYLNSDIEFDQNDLVNQISVTQNSSAVYVSNLSYYFGISTLEASSALPALKPLNSGYTFSHWINLANAQRVDAIPEGWFGIWENATSYSLNIQLKAVWNLEE